jgi:hypothetical protein
MERWVNPYKEVEWLTDRMTVEELALFVRAERGDILAGVDLLVSRSQGALDASYVRGADIESWRRWNKEMKDGVDRANAPDAARQIEQQLQARIPLPPNLRLRVEIADEAAGVPVDLHKLLGGVDLSGDVP